MQEKERTPNRSATVPEDRVFFFVLLFTCCLFRCLVSVFPEKITCVLDEEYYLEIAQSIFSHGSVMIYNSSVSFTKLLYPLVLAPFYNISDPQLRLTVISVFNSLLISSSLIPGWLLARRILKNKWHIRLSLIILAILPDMGFSSLFLSENLQLPLVIWGFWWLFRLLEQPERYRVYSPLLGFWCFLLYFCKESSLALFVSVLIVVSYRAFRRPAGSSVSRISPASVILLLAGFVLPYLIAHFTVFRRLGYTYSGQVSLQNMDSPATLMFFLYSGIKLIVSFSASWLILPVILPVLYRKTLTDSEKSLLSFSVIFIVLIAFGTAFGVSLHDDFSAGEPRIHLRYFIGAFYPFLLLFLSSLDNSSFHPPLRRCLSLVIPAAAVTALFINRPYLQSIADSPSLYAYSLLCSSNPLMVTALKLVPAAALLAGFLLYRRYGAKPLLVFLLPLVMSGEVLNHFAFVRITRDTGTAQSGSLVREIREMDSFLESHEGNALFICDSSMSSLLKAVNPLSDSEYSLTSSDTLSSLAVQSNTADNIRLKVSDLPFPLNNFEPDDLTPVDRADFLLVAEPDVQLNYDDYEDVTPPGITFIKILRSSDPYVISMLDPTSYSTGDIISFTGSGTSFSSFLPSGFSVPRGGFTWSEGKTASLTVKPDIENMEPLQAEWVLSQALSDQTCTVYAGVNKVYSGALPAEGGIISFSIPESSYDESGHITLRFEFPRAKKPGNGDSRILAAGFRSLIIESDANVLHLPEGLTSVASETFMGISAEIVYIPDGIVEIEPHAFAGCQNLRYIHIPDSVEMISASAFEGCSEGLVIYSSEDSWIKGFCEENGILFIPE